MSISILYIIATYCEWQRWFHDLYNSQRFRPISAHNPAQEKRRQRQWVIATLRLLDHGDADANANRKRSISPEVLNLHTGVPGNSSRRNIAPL